MKESMLKSRVRAGKKKMKIVFISPRPFGLMGTPGTYLLTESYGKFADIRIISNKKKRGYIWKIQSL